jgi:O-antigen ligase
MRWHRFGRYVSSVLVCVILALVLLSEWIVSGTAPGWLQSVGMEIQAACRDTGTQWMVMVCLVSYFVTFLFLERRLFEPQKNAENAKEETAPPTSDFWPLSSSSALLAFFRGQNSDAWLVGFVVLVLARYAVSYEMASLSLSPLVLLAGIVFGKGLALWVAWQPSLKAKGSGLKLMEKESRHLTSSLTPVEAERASASLTINSQLPTSNAVEPGSPLPAALANNTNGAHGASRPTFVLTMLVLLLACASLWQPEYGMEFQYHGQRRWTGPWDNPNIYGILMGVGAILAVGLLVSRLKAKGQSRSTSECGTRSAEWPRWVKIILLLTAAGLCALGLVKSYSRGAWVGTACGLGWLLWQWISRTHLTPALSPRPPGGEGEALSCHSCVSWFTRNWRPFCVVLASALVLSFWQFRYTENPLARRVFSIGNPNDFSWRNRVATWAGAVTMLKDRPWLGHGWGKAEEVFRKQYKPVRLEDTAAIQMNDYLMLGISCGVPALLCFVSYIWLSCRRPMGASRARTELQTSDLRLQTSVVATAGATVLLIGFWFDGGLFKLVTGAVFWVLVELSRSSRRGNAAQANEGGARHSVRAVGGESVCASQLVGSLAPPSGDTSSSCANFSPFEAEREGGAHGVPRPTMVLRWLAGIMAALAVGQTALHLVTPRLAVSERTLAIARRFLVPSKAEKDFEFLAAKPIWSSKALQTLLTHVELAHYNRELVNWKLEDHRYREFVLSPLIDPAWDGSMNWRRPLWEYLYPRIRKENSLAAAAEIVGRHLRERITITQSPPSQPDGSVAEMWRRQSADEKGFAAVYVAALRSTGIPARLNPQGQTEYWNGAAWELAPRPVTATKGNG